MESVKIRCMCDKHVFDSSDLKHTKIENEYWIFAHCKKCKYDYNYLKIFRQYNAILADQSHKVDDMRTLLEGARKLKDKWNPEELK